MNRFYGNRPGVRGFTLIELLAVISIIAILASAITASTMRARQMARITKAEAEVREILNAIRLFDMVTGKLPASMNSGTMIPTEYNNIRDLIEPNAAQGNRVYLKAEIEEREPMLDPWGNPYIIYIREETPGGTETRVDVYETGALVPGARNWSDKRDDELREEVDR